MRMTEAQRAALDQMLDTAENLDRWRLRAHRIEEPETGSELDLDDAISPYMAISQLARMSLILSGEHLRLALDAVRAMQLYPSSHFTVLRGALVGASQALWILAPENRCQRQERGHIVLTEMYAQMSKQYRFLESTELSTSDRAALQDQQRWLNQRHTEVASLRITASTLNLTDVIGAAADHVLKDAKQRIAVRRIWRETSADAHVLGWSLFQRANFGRPDRRTGVGDGAASGSPEHVAVFLASYRLLREGRSLFDGSSQSGG